MSMKITKNVSEKIVKDIKSSLGDETKITIYNGRYFDKNIPEFIMMFQSAGKSLFKILTPGACKVLGYMFSMMQYGNHIGCDQKTLSEELDLSIRTINGAVNELKNLNVILSYPDPQDRRRMVYMVNGHAAWKGHTNKRKKHLKDNPAQLKLTM